jgi:hypothetical protein
MAEEYVEAVVAKASDFGDNEWVDTIFCTMNPRGEKECMNINDFMLWMLTHIYLVYSCNLWPKSHMQ